MGLSFQNSNRMFFFLGVVLQLWFILMYALDYYYVLIPVGTGLQQVGAGFLSTQGFLLVLFLLLLFFLGSIIITQDLPLLTHTSLDQPTHQPSYLSWSLSSPSNITSLSEVSGLELDSEMITTITLQVLDHISLSVFLITITDSNLHTHLNTV